MNKKALKEKITFIKTLENQEKWDEAHQEAEILIKTLFEEKRYLDIVKLDQDLQSVPITFEVAYSYHEVGNLDRAEEIYETILSIPGEESNIAVLNNLSSVKKEKGKIKEAYDLIQKAFKIDNNDEVVKHNYENLSRIIQEKEEKEILFKNALENLKRETEWALKKLSNFISNVRKDKDYRGVERIAIPRWKFKVLIGTDDKKAESLRDQWIRKGYIKDTGERTDYSVSIYEINPYLEDFIKHHAPVKLNQQWFDGFEAINIENLTRVNYFDIISRIEKINKKYQEFIWRDFDELIFNYFVKNRKATIVLAGSFVELLFTYYCERKNIKEIEYSLSGKKVKRDLYECVLSDFLNYFQEHGTFKSILIHIGNLTRIYRNFIHPGNELDTQEVLNDSKMEICFHSVIEITKLILK